jgi:hypothetical protein
MKGYLCGLVVLGALGLLFSCGAVAEADFTIMPLGASITSGSGGTSGCYRDRLYTELHNIGLSFTFVGSSTENPSPLLTQAGRTHHEGHPGYRIDQVANNLDGNDGSPGNNRGFWFHKPEPPNIIPLEAGRNDIAQSFQTSTMAQRMDKLVGQIFADNPNTILLLSSSIPSVSCSARATAVSRPLRVPLSGTSLSPWPWGTLTFGAAQNYVVASSFPGSMVVADFNGDGHLDIAVGSHDPEEGPVSILLGNGDGTFQAAQNYHFGGNPASLAVGDFNGDGHLDLAAIGRVYPGPGTVNVLLGNGDGTFRVPQDYACRDGSGSLAVGDFNGDGRLDIVTDGSILLGNGDGTFRAAQNNGVLPNPGLSLAVGDFDGNGRLDLIVAGYDFFAAGDDHGMANVLLSNGDGTFQAAQNYDAGYRPGSVGVGDFNGDGHLDFAVANPFSDTVTVLLNTGDWGR